MLSPSSHPGYDDLLSDIDPTSPWWGALVGEVWPWCWTNMPETKRLIWCIGFYLWFVYHGIQALPLDPKDAHLAGCEDLDYPEPFLSYTRAYVCLRQYWLPANQVGLLPPLVEPSQLPSAPLTATDALCDLTSRVQSWARNRWDAIPHYLSAPDRQWAIGQKPASVWQPPPMSAKTLVVSVLEDRKVVVLVSKETGEEVEIPMKGGKAATKWSVQYGHFRSLLMRLREDLAAGTSHAEAGWVSGDALALRTARTGAAGEREVDVAKRQVAGALRAQMTRLRKLLADECGGLITVAKATEIPAEGQDQDTQHTMGYRLEGRVLEERWAIEADLPDPGV